MRILPTLIATLSIALAVSAAPAHAEERVAFDFGYLQNRVAISDQTSVRGSLGRFAIRIGIGRYLHFGGEVDEAWLSGSTGLPNGGVARTNMPTASGSPLEGNMLAQKLLVGVHTRTGAFSVVADLAGGYRDTMITSDEGFDVAGRKQESLLEMRTRLDYWLSPTVTVGAVASADLIVRQDVAFGAIVAMHFGNHR